ncbi:TonB-dependent siderophore receptor [Nostocaceae cyanobacterium CENA369]|uniref:TonB-dependent siderophore receptor n=1 Tax=Dendronalium phyllosphericum CENA369 TaxID=1725256 RepID=A0A8J7LJK5_9NOST|nr:TonB-dependent siderophore receptor [Dendronalium phyllosphericum]MBH8577768.1 TonB-dependent siderophore receptor [Dendronalium phyllosphericum CENA369]
MLLKLPCAVISTLLPILCLNIANSAYAKQPSGSVSSASEVQSAKTSAIYLLRTPKKQNKVSQLSQATTDVVSVTDVQVNATDKGIELILVTSNSDKLQVKSRTEGNSYIADIPNTHLQLASGESFQQLKPAVGIAEVTVASQDANTLRVTVVGETGAPTVELFDSTQEGLVFGVSAATTTAQQPTTTPQQQPQTEQSQPPIELKVTAPPDTGYRVPDTSVGTKTDTPLRDIPQSIQVIPRQVLDDQKAQNFSDALRNTGIIGALVPASTNADIFTIRGFQQSRVILRNGLRDPSRIDSGRTQLTNIERIEVLKGPGSVLYGQQSPGGTVNYITKQPLTDPYFAATMSVGSYDFYQPALDISGPLNSDKTALYRLNFSYNNSGSFIDFLSSRNLLIAPVFAFRLGKNTTFKLEGEFLDQEQDSVNNGLPAAGTVLPNRNGKIPLNRNVSEPTDSNFRYSTLLSYSLEHKFNDNWVLRNAFHVRFVRNNQDILFPTGLLSDGRTLNRIKTSFNGPTVENTYVMDTNVVGKFKTGNIEHELLVGFDLFRDISALENIVRQAGSLDLFNPIYGQPLGSITSTSHSKTRNDALGLYIQDRVKFFNNLKLVLGGRLDFAENEVTNFITSQTTSQNDSVFSPRVGIVYQPIEPVSLYASYSQSFTQNVGATFDGSLFEPSRGTQYEVGVKTDLLNNKLSATLALYQLTLSNVLTQDLAHPSFNIQTGEQQSRGVELNVIGEILPGWNVIASYNYTYAQITSDNRYKVGNLLVNVPENSASLWTTYIIPNGNLRGLGGGFGVFYVGERQGDLNNSFSVPNYLQLDAALYYRRNNLRLALNLKNLSDVRYFTPRSATQVYPSDPFTVVLTVGLEF